MGERSRTTAFVALLLGAAGFVPFSLQGQRIPRFEDYPVTEVFRGRPVKAVLDESADPQAAELIQQGVEKGWGVFDGVSGKELSQSGANFAGHFELIRFGCGKVWATQCLKTAVVDAQSGQVFYPPGGQQFPGDYPAGSFHAAQGDHFAHDPMFPYEYRLHSRLLIAHVCDGDRVVGSGVIGLERLGCGPHYYLLTANGWSLVYQAPDEAPKFADFPASARFHGKPAATVFLTAEERLVKEPLRDALRKIGPNPNFAGHYLLASWDCGEACRMAAIVDARTGRVFAPPFESRRSAPGYFRIPWAVVSSEAKSVLARAAPGVIIPWPEVPRPYMVPAYPALEFRADSGLLFAHICDSDSENRRSNFEPVSLPCSRSYFTIGEDGFRLIYREGGAVHE